MEILRTWMNILNVFIYLLGLQKGTSGTQRRIFSPGAGRSQGADFI